MEIFDRIFGPVVQAQSASLLNEEAMGWELWLHTMGPKTFTQPFSDAHVQFWEWFWDIVMKRKKGLPLSEEEMVFLALLARGLGKSSMMEWATLMEGAILGQGYVLYISCTQDLAEQHLEAIRSRLEASEISRYYPGMANPKVGKFGQKFGWRQDTLITDSGWAIAAFGLDTGVRGGKQIDQRPSVIVLDDIDALHDTPQLVGKKIDVLARSIFPTGTSNTIILGAQNLIHRNSIFNQIVTGNINLLARRRQTPVVPAIYDLQIERQGTRDIIVGGTPAWEGFDLKAAQKALDDSAYSAFMAEYQHDFASTQEGLIVPEFNEAVHVISWSEFQSVYGSRSIPEHWQKEAGLDWGSSGLHAHPTAVSFIATAAEDSALPGLYFLYHGMTFGEGVIVDDVAERIISLVGEDSERPGCADLTGFRRWVASHEAKSERDTFRKKFGIPFRPPATASRTGGVSMWRHFMRADYTMPHPFKAEGKGYAMFYWIVADDQLEGAVDDRGLRRWREEVLDWRWRPQVVGAAGLVSEVPVKFRDDACDSVRYLTGQWLPPATPLTDYQIRERSLPEGVRNENMPTDPQAREGWEMARWLQEARQAMRKENLARRQDNAEAHN
jgi:hypothetical protein